MVYSLDNAKKFKWSSISGDLNPERRAHLEKYLVGKKILDAGCGGGAYVEFLTHQGFDTTGIDKYDEFLQAAQENKRLGTYVQGDVTALPFPDKLFDCTYCFDVLEHIDDQLAISELARVTKHRLIIAVPREDETMQKFNLTFLHYQDKTHLRNYTEVALRELCQRINYSDIQIVPELFIPMSGLVHELVDLNLTRFLAKEIASLARKIRIKQTLNIISDKRESQEIAEEFYRLKFLNGITYKQIPTGLVSVVDL